MIPKKKFINFKVSHLCSKPSNEFSFRVKAKVG